jgi:hypothetical protein
MEARLVELSKEFKTSRSEETRAEYRSLHAQWVQACASAGTQKELG